MNWINGRKTYIGMAALGIAGILLSVGVIPEEFREAIYAIVAGWSGVSIRHAIAKGK